MVGRTLLEWTLKDIQDILDGIFLVHDLMGKELFYEDIIKMKEFRNVDLPTLYQYYVVWRNDYRNHLVTQGKSELMSHRKSLVSGNTR